MQFVTEASKAGHPASLKSFAPAVLHEVTEFYRKTKVHDSIYLHEVTEFYRKTKVHDRIEFRADQIKHWVNRCKLLTSDEKKVHEQLPSHARKLMQSKRFLLWQEMFESCQYQDMGVVSEMKQGVHLTGEASRTKLWPEKFTPAAVTFLMIRK